MRVDARAGDVKVLIQAANMVGQGMTYQDVARKLGVRDVTRMIRNLNDNGVRANEKPSGYSEVRAFVPGSTYALMARHVAGAGYELHTGVGEFLRRAVQHGTIKSVLRDT